MKIVDPGRLGRTVVNLRPAQFLQRLRLRTQRMLLDREVSPASRWLLGGPDPAVAPGWPSEFTPLDACLWLDSQAGNALRKGELSVLGVLRVLAHAGPAGDVDWAGADWEAADAPLLWRFHLYYWDWAWALIGQSQDASSDPCGEFAAIWQSWHSAITPGRGPAWHPYPAALRAWSFCGIYRHLVVGGPLDGLFRADMAAHAGFLRHNLETDVGGNHLVKNLKALAGLAVFFGDDKMLTWSLSRLGRQLHVQVLPDGGHYERAPAYHCQVLSDLIDIAVLLRVTGHPGLPGLPETIAAMRGWLGSVVTPCGSVPLLNDGFPVSPQLLALIAPATPPVAPLHLLRDTGLARISIGWWHVLADVGPPCPRELPAHAHADTLSCVVHVNGVPLLVDTGTSTYAAGPTRDRERSTAAHNTAEVDLCDSTEVWGAFRAGRRARVTDVSACADTNAVMVEAAHDGYRNLPGRPVHRRRWTVLADELRVDDELTGTGRHRVTVRWHLAPGASLRLVADGAVVSTAAGEITVSVSGETADSGEPALTAVSARIGAGFDTTVEVPVLVCALTGELPVRISTRWCRGDVRQESL